MNPYIVRRTHHKCWKCGQNVPHHLCRRDNFWNGQIWRWGFGKARSRHGIVAIKHYVEKDGRFEVCKGSGALP